MGWAEAAGETHEEKEEAACRGCHLFETKPDFQEIESTSFDEDEIKNLVDEVRRLISLDNCKIPIDWERKNFMYFYLFQYWRDCEEEIRYLRENKTAYFQEFILARLSLH